MFEHKILINYNFYDPTQEVALNMSLLYCAWVNYFVNIESAFLTLLEMKYLQMYKVNGNNQGNGTK